MLQDANFVYSDAQSAISSSDEASTNITDLQVADPDIGSGTPLWINCTVNTVYAGTGGGMTVLLQESDDNSTWTTALSSQAYSVAELTQGTVLMSVPLPAYVKRYIRLNYSTKLCGFSSGNVDAYLSSAPVNTLIGSRT